MLNSPSDDSLSLFCVQKDMVYKSLVYLQDRAFQTATHNCLGHEDLLDGVRRWSIHLMGVSTYNCHGRSEPSLSVSETKLSIFGDFADL